MKDKSLSITIAILLAGCVSNHDLNQSMNIVGNGGTQKTEIKQGLYYLLARTNWGWVPSFSAAGEMWAKATSELCGSEGYVEFDVREITEGKSPYVMAERHGYVLCKSAGISISEARDAIKKHYDSW